MRPGLYKNIILSGATTMFPGYASRIDKELRKLYVDNNLKHAESKDIKIPIKMLEGRNKENNN